MYQMFKVTFYTWVHDKKFKFCYQPSSTTTTITYYRPCGKDRPKPICVL